MGWLVALQQLPVPLFGLFFGVWVDRLRRRPLMVLADVGRAILLAAIPAAAFLGALSLPQVYLVAFLAGTLSVLFDLGITSHLPSMVRRSDLLDANSKLQMTTYMAGIAGRGLGGALVQALTAPIALLVDAASFLVSALSLALIRRPEPGRAREGEPAGLWREIGQGMRFTLREPVIAAMTLASTLGALGGAMQQTVLFLFMANQLALPSLWIGIIVGTSTAGAWIGTQLAAPLAARGGPGPVLVAGSFLGSAGAFLLPLAALGPLPASPALLAGQTLSGLGLAIYSINQITLREAITPDRMLGRVNATRRVLVFGAIPVGALAGGALGEALGLRATLVVGAFTMLISAVYAAASPLRRARAFPAA